jgi:hypothetical protein
VLAAAQAGAALAVGLDIAPLAVRAAEELRDSTLTKEAAAHAEFAECGCTPAGVVRWGPGPGGSAAACLRRFRVLRA